MSFYLFQHKASRNYYVRGTHGAINIDKFWSGGRTTRTADKREASRILAEWERLAEQSMLPDGRHIADIGKPVDLKDTLTFAQAAQVYITHKSLVEGTKAWGFVNRIVEHKSPKHGVIGRMLCKQITDTVVMDIANELYGQGGKPATRNRGCYTPIKAVLKRNGFGFLCADINRPANWNAYVHSSFIDMGDELNAVLAAADEINLEFGLYCECLAYTPTREGMWRTLRVHNVDLDAASVFFPGLGVEGRTKNGESQLCHLTDRLVVRLRAHLAGKDPNDLVFSAQDRRHVHKALQAVPALYERLGKRHRGFHIFRHTYGSAMAALGVDLLDTGGWKTQASARKYVHKVSPAAKRVAELPARPLLAVVA